MCSAQVIIYKPFSVLLSVRGTWFYFARYSALIA